MWVSLLSLELFLSTTTVYILKKSSISISTYYYISRIRRKLLTFRRLELATNLTAILFFTVACCAITLSQLSPWIVIRSEVVSTKKNIRNRLYKLTKRSASFFCRAFLPAVSDIPTSWFCVEYVFDHQSSYVLISTRSKTSWLQNGSDPDKLWNCIDDDTRSRTLIRPSCTLKNHVEISAFCHFIASGNDTLSAYQDIIIDTLSSEFDESLFLLRKHDQKKQANQK